MYRMCHYSVCGRHIILDHILTCYHTWFRQIILSYRMVATSYLVQSTEIWRYNKCGRNLLILDATLQLWQLKFGSMWLMILSVLGWISIPLAVETYGCWGAEAQSTISRLASRLAIQLQCSKSKAITTIYQRLNITLIRANTRALLSRSGLFRPEGGV